jgi:hypothetical protein
MPRRAERQSAERIVWECILINWGLEIENGILNCKENVRCSQITDLIARKRKEQAFYAGGSV